VCPHHAAALCECGPSEWRLLFRFTLAQLQERLGEAAARVGMVRASHMLLLLLLPLL
jgi:hypothetical protein